MLKIDLPGYEQVIPNVYARKYGTHKFEKDDVPAIMLTRLTRATIPTKEDVLDFLVECASLAIAREHHEESRVVGEIRGRVQYPFPEKIAARDPKILAKLGRSYDHQMYVSIDGTDYLIQETGIVPERSFRQKPKEYADEEDYAQLLFDEGENFWSLTLALDEQQRLQVDKIRFSLETRVIHSGILEYDGEGISYFDVKAKVEALLDVFGDSKAPRYLPNSSFETLEGKSSAVLATFNEIMQRSS